MAIPDPHSCKPVHSPRRSSVSAGGRRFSVHGLAVELSCGVSGLLPELGHFLHAFEESEWPNGFTPVSGYVHPFEMDSVQHHVSATATPFAGTRDLMELYQEGDRFWLIDDRWGMAELNLLKARWRSWVLPRPRTDAMRCAEMAVLWPMAQLLRSRGMHLLPAVSVARDGWGALIICPFGIEPELTAMVRSGYRVIGQRWTALREEDGRIAMLHVPGSVERNTAPRLRAASTGAGSAALQSQRIDVTAEFPGSHQNHAFCDAVFVTDAVRRPVAAAQHLSQLDAANMLRHAWPIVDLTPQRRGHQIAPRLAQQCRCGELQLSRHPHDLLRLLDEFRAGRRAPAAPPVTVPPVTVSLYPKPVTQRRRVAERRLAV